MQQSMEKVKNNVSFLFKVFVDKSFDVNHFDIDNIIKAINAYNQYQEDMRFGVDYLFDSENKDDIIICLNGGMSLDELESVLKSKRTLGSSTFFLFGENYPCPIMLSLDELKRNLINHSDEIAECILAYPWIDVYREFYTEWITNHIIE